MRFRELRVRLFARAVHRACDEGRQDAIGIKLDRTPN